MKKLEIRIACPDSGSGFDPGDFGREKFCEVVKDFLRSDMSPGVEK